MRVYFMRSDKKGSSRQGFLLTSVALGGAFIVAGFSLLYEVPTAPTHNGSIQAEPQPPSNEFRELKITRPEPLQAREAEKAIRLGVSGTLSKSEVPKTDAGLLSRERFAEFRKNADLFFETVDSCSNCIPEEDYSSSMTPEEIEVFEREWESQILAELARADIMRKLAGDQNVLTDRPRAQGYGAIALNATSGAELMERLVNNRKKRVIINDNQNSHFMCCVVQLIRRCARQL